MPGCVRFLPLNTRDVAWPLTTATGDTEINSGELHDFQDLQMRMLPEDFSKNGKRTSGSDGKEIMKKQVDSDQIQSVVKMKTNV